MFTDLLRRLVQFTTPQSSGCGWKPQLASLVGVQLCRVLYKIPQPKTVAIAYSRSLVFGICVVELGGVPSPRKLC